MSDNNFFKKEEENMNPQNQEETSADKVKIGEKEYAQEDLSRLVGLGEMATELEAKWNTKVDRLYPEFTKATQEREEYKKKVEQYEASKTQEKVEKGEELSPEELQKRALAEAERLGLVHKDNVYQFMDAYLQARDMKADAEALIVEAAESGKPKTSVDELFNYMNETGIKNIELAYKSKYEKELDTWKQSQLEKLKNGDMRTMDASSAGSKQPEPQKLTDLTSLSDAMKSYFNRTG